MLENCCSKCHHSSSNPCKDWVICKTEGPLCHTDKSCQNKIKNSLYQIPNEKTNLVIKIGMSTCGLAAGAGDTLNEFEKILRERNTQAEIIKVGCMGHCYAEPIVEIIEPNGSCVIYKNIKNTEVENTLNNYFDKKTEGVLAIRNKKGTLSDESNIPLFENLVFNKKQKRIILNNCGIINPEKIEDYIESGGYRALSKILIKLSPQEVIDQIKTSKLRGRGGAGFPTGQKWQICHDVKNDQKYFICNADEGDPGAFMNRLLAEGDPHRVLEGLIISAYAIGASKGYIFVRAEKSFMAKHLKLAVNQAKHVGLLGNNILNSNFNLEVEVVLSAGAFVCGEETALLAALEGKRAMPRPRPPYPATQGLFGKPTTINNVETLAHVPTIILNNELFTSIGTEKSKGTKVFCLAGKVKRTGAAEVPFGTTLKELIFDIGGGIVNDRKFKAVQTGGPSGGCLSDEFLNLPLDYEKLAEVGSIMGSGGVIVLDEDSCVVDTAKYFLNFTTKESCGKCTPCRIGLKRLQEILEKITKGQGNMADLDDLNNLGKLIINTSLCALGQGAPNPILTTIKYFPEEYQEHIEKHRCPSHVCSNLVDYRINPDECINCGNCAKNCPVSAINILTLDGSKQYSIELDKCLRCEYCFNNCPMHAIFKV